MAKRITVIKIDSTRLTDEDSAETVALETTKATLRVLRPLGLRFSTEEIDGHEVTVTAWLEEKGEPKPKRERQALGTTGVASPPGAAE